MRIFVGWVERSETHHLQKIMNFIALFLSYAGWSVVVRHLWVRDNHRIISSEMIVDASLDGVEVGGARRRGA